MTAAEFKRDGTDVYEGQVQPEWIDINNHMNVAYYVLAFDRGIDCLWSRFGITDAYIRESNNSTFAVESHITYQRELRLAEPFIVTSELLAYDDKRIHQFMRIYHATNNYLASTAEWMNLHVDLDRRRVAPWPADILDNIKRFANSQRDNGMPAEAGQRMQLKSPSWSMQSYQR
ncbi:MAG TPA: thioesterase family protein [Woeseiaceae bacterium]|nr:thioesterase family protein [Woeseiaceae bacterium]